MKKVNVYQYEDLKKDVKEKVLQNAINEEVDFQLDLLRQDLNNKVMNEDQYYKLIGCSKSYAESTAWFIPACYYEHNKIEVDKAIVKTMEISIFDKLGTVIYL